MPVSEKFPRILRRVRSRGFATSSSAAPPRRWEPLHRWEEPTRTAAPPHTLELLHTSELMHMLV